MQDLKIQYEINFFTLLNIGQNAPKKWNSNYIVLNEEMLSDSIKDLGKCPNRKMHESESACFPVGALCKVQNQILKHFSHKVLYNFYSKFFWSNSASI